MPVAARLTGGASEGIPGDFGLLFHVLALAMSTGGAEPLGCPLVFSFAHRLIHDSACSLEDALRQKPPMPRAKWLTATILSASPATFECG